MPRWKINLKQGVDYLSVLDADGTLDEAHAPDIPDDLLLDMHRTMLLARRADERELKLQRAGKIGTFGPIKGQEATQLGTVVHLRETDWLVPSYRELGALIWRGVPLENPLIFCAGYNEGCAVPEGWRTLPIAIPVGTQPLHAVGLAYAARYRGTDDIAMTYFGDGATSQGDLHEAMNFAGVYRLPVVFVCNNNQYAISLPRGKQTASETIAQKALAYGFPGIQVDGNDLLAVYAATQEAVDRARNDHIPTLIECITYRLGVHTTADDPTRYRSDEEVKKWEARDPIPRIQGYLKAKGLLDDDGIADLEDWAKKEITAAWHRAQERMTEYAKHPEAMFDHLYAEAPPHLKAQRAAFEKLHGIGGEATDE